MARYRALSTMALALSTLPACADEVFTHDPYVGAVSLRQTASNKSLAWGSFFSVPDLKPLDTTPLSECRLVPVSTEGGSSAPLGEVLDAGELRVTGGVGELVTDFQSGYRVERDPAVFQTGDTLTLQVEGSESVTPMSATLAVPPAVVIAPPPAVIDRSQDLTFTWDGSAAKGTINIWLNALVPSDAPPAVAVTAASVVCTVDAEKGAVTMPASLLSQLPVEGEWPASVGALARNNTYRQAGLSRVGFSVEVAALTPDGVEYSFQPDLK